MVLSLVTARANIPEPITVQEAKQHCRIDGDSDNAAVASWIMAAREFVESYTDRQLVTAQYTMTLDEFPASTVTNPEQYIWLPKGELQSVDSLTYLDGDGDSQTLTENTDFVVDASGDWARIALAYGKTWPTTRAQINTVTITYTCGYGAAVDVPEVFKSAIKMLVSHWYEHREAAVAGVTVAEMKTAVEEMLAPYRLLEYA